MHFCALVVTATIIATISAKPVLDNSWLSTVPPDEELVPDAEPGAYTDTIASSDFVPDYTTGQTLVASGEEDAHPQDTFMKFQCTDKNGVCCLKNEVDESRDQQQCDQSTFPIHSFASAQPPRLIALAHRTLRPPMRGTRVFPFLQHFDQLASSKTVSPPPRGRFRLVQREGGEIKCPGA